MRGDFLLGNPAIDESPVVQHHVVHPVGRHGTKVAHDVDSGAVYGENAAADLVRRPGRDLRIAVDRIGLQVRYQEASSLVARTADEDSAAQHRSANAPCGQAREIGGDDDAFVGLHIPERKRTLDHVDAVAVGPVGLCARIRCDDVQSLDLDVSATDLVARQDLDLSRRGDPGKGQVTQTFNACVIEDGSLVRGGAEANVSDLVVGRKLQSFDARRETNLGAISFAPQRLPGRKPHGWRVSYASAHLDLANLAVPGCRYQFTRRGDDTFFGNHHATPSKKRDTQQ